MGGFQPNCQAQTVVKLAKEEKAINITKINIGLLQSQNSSFPTDENAYCAEAIEHGGQYFYRVGDTTVEAEHYEYEQVIQNPRLYYFSSALKLHHRIKKARSLGIGYDWPKNAAGSINIFQQGK